jgi:hypothetical protein
MLLSNVNKKYTPQIQVTTRRQIYNNRIILEPNQVLTTSPMNVAHFNNRQEGW